MISSVVRMIYVDPCHRTLVTGSGSASSVISTNRTSVPTNNGVSSSSSNDNNNDDVNQAKKSPRVVDIVGGVAGGLVFLAASGIGIWIFYRGIRLGDSRGE